MRRLHLKLYLAIVGTMVVFLIAGAVCLALVAPPQHGDGRHRERDAACRQRCSTEREHDPRARSAIDRELSRPDARECALYDPQATAIATSATSSGALTREELASPDG